MIAEANLVVGKPETWSHEAAATLPSAFVTAHYALNRIGNLSRGDRVLIHAAAGGVGMAAVQLALKAGAVVFGTAGSEEKRAFLQSIGVHHVMNSRTADFSVEIMKETDGRGIDVVLNSLSGDFITKSLAVLSLGGRFLEIGKRDILSIEEAATIRPDVTYHIIDLVQVTLQSPHIVRELLKEIVSFAHDTFQPLPFTLFPLSKATEAFRFMAQAKHTGKIVITNDIAPPHSLRKRIRDDATYVITGGCKGLGLLVAEELVRSGARYLALMGRSAADETAQVVIQGMEKAGVTIQVIKVDVSQGVLVERAIQEIEEHMPAIKGIIHSAGTLADGVMMKQDWNRFRTGYGAPNWTALGIFIIPVNIWSWISSSFFFYGRALWVTCRQGNHAAAERIHGWIRWVSPLPGTSGTKHQLGSLVTRWRRGGTQGR